MKRHLCLLFGVVCAGLVTALAARAELPPLTSVPNSHRLTGKFVWADLVTDDEPTARRFYTRTFGWKFRDLGNHSIAHSNERPLAGMLFSQHINTRAASHDSLAKFYSDRLRGEAKVACDACLAARLLENAEAPPHPSVTNLHRPQLLTDAAREEQAILAGAVGVVRKWEIAAQLLPMLQAVVADEPAAAHQPLEVPSQDQPVLRMKLSTAATERSSESMNRGQHSPGIT
jgi:hypothetical protein